MINPVKATLLGILFVFCGHIAIANDVTQNYIQQYKHIAINEMNEYGIPASIKMAQAILESSSGQSTLAKESNNHFGIKCGGSWTGRKAYREDDDYENGLLVKSCFRVYDDPAESFRAHSEFLANPNTTRYKRLFKLDRYDYKGWAKGLREEGYATDKKYPQKLITVIEKYELYLLDYGLVDQEPLIVDNGSSFKKSTPSTSPSSQTKKKSQPIIITANTSSKENRNSSQIRLPQGFYTVKDGDNMVAIAKKYNMEPKDLYFKNRMKYGSEPLVGQQLAVNHYIHFGVVPKTASESEKTAEESILWKESMSIGAQ